MRPPFEPGVVLAAEAVALGVDAAEETAMLTSIAFEVEAALAVMADAGWWGGEMGALGRE